MVEKNGYKGYGFDVLLNIGADRMDITPPPCSFPCQSDGIH